MLERKNVFLSLKPHFANLIFEGKKTVELRRRFSPHLKSDVTVYIYSTNPVKQLIGYVLVKKMIKKSIHELWETVGIESCVDYHYFRTYFNGLTEGYALLLEQPFLFDRPIGLNTLRTCNYPPPQSYRFVPDNFLDILQGTCI